MTGRSRWIGVVLALLVAAQFCHGTFSIVWIALGPRKSLDNSTVRVRTHWFLSSATVPRDKFGSVRGLRLQNMEPWGTHLLQSNDCFRSVLTPQPAVLLHPGSSVTSHIPHPLCCGIIDLLAFLIILVTARKSRESRYPGMPSILDIIVRDSTQYFVLIFFSQLVAQLFVFFAPVGDTRYV